MKIIPGLAFDFEVFLVTIATGLAKTTGTIYAYVHRSSNGYYLWADAAWHATLPTGADVPTATHTTGGDWKLTASAGITGALATPGETLTCSMRDAESEAAATVIGASHSAQVDVTTSSRLAPTTAGRTLDVSAGGEAGLDWSNIGAPTSTQGLTGTTIGNVAGTVAGHAGQVTVTVLDSLGAPLAGVLVTLRASGVVVSAGTTNGSGVAVLSHAGGTITVLGFIGGYSITTASLGALAADAVTTAALTATLQQGTAAADPGACTVYTTLRHLDLSVAAGVTGTCRVASLPAELSANFVEGASSSATSSGAGLISWTAPRGARVVVEIPGHLPATLITVPNAASVNLSTLV
jgi:hypothetical protein